jgi:peptidoglycan/LPS O-acetylase OafA/YrhL
MMIINQFMARIPTLDGWRGIAILLVIATHFQSGIIGHPIVGLPWMNLGQHGVGIFFVLSGYLITTQLLQDEKINLKRFYLRRFFRLMSCAWTYLLFVEILALILGTHLIGKDAWSCLFFFRNYYPALETGSNTLTGHFWSLSLEEQFYLVWPSLLVIVRRRWALPLASAGVTSCTIFRLFHWQQYETALLYLRTEVRADALLVGCILALLLERRAIKEWIECYGKFAFWLCIPPLAWDVYHYQLLIPLSESILFAIMIACTSQNPNSAPSRVLEWQHLKFTGLMSYSIYMWQDIFLRNNWGFYGPILLVVAAFASWLLVERPCIRLGRLVEKRLASKTQLRTVPAHALPSLEP